MVVDAAKRFLRNNSGTTAVIFGLAMLPITIGVGAAIDYSRAANARAEMQTAVDAAALGAAREGGKLDDAGLSTLGRDFFDANFKSRDSVNVSTMSVAPVWPHHKGGGQGRRRHLDHAAYRHPDR